MKFRTYSTNQAIDIFNPAAYAYSNCLKEKKVGIDRDSESATVLIGLVSGRSLTKIANDLHSFRREISRFEKVALANQQGIKSTVRTILNRQRWNAGFSIITEANTNGGMRVSASASKNVRSIVKYDYSVMEATHAGYLFLAPDGQHFIAIGYSLDRPDSNQETANRIINSISFQRQ